MSSKIKVGILGATGMVGQNYVRLLNQHPWFDVAYVAASSQSANKTYEDAVAGRWHMSYPIPESVRDLIMQDKPNICARQNKCAVLFSGISVWDKKAVAALELEYASNGFAVISNNSAHRFTSDVPMVIPEINFQHLHIIPFQRKKRGWSSGLIAVKSNCSIQSYMTPLYALIKGGYEISQNNSHHASGIVGRGNTRPVGLGCH